jgi:hypothetical protein
MMNHSLAPCTTGVMTQRLQRAQTPTCIDKLAARTICSNSASTLLNAPRSCCKLQRPSASWPACARLAGVSGNQYCMICMAEAACDSSVRVTDSHDGSLWVEHVCAV